MIGKKKTAQKPNAEKNRQPVNNTRGNAPQNGASRNANPAKNTPSRTSGGPRNMPRNSQNQPNNRVSPSRPNSPNSAQSKVPADKNAQIRSGANAQKPVQKGSVKGKKRFSLGKKPKKTAVSPTNRQTVPTSSPNVQNRSAAVTQKPVNEQARRAADKAALAKNRTAVSEKKRPYRGGNYTLYFILAAIIVGIVMAVLSNTVLFKCGSIEVSGTTRYSSEEIIAASGVKTGENLLHIDAKKAEENVMNAFAFVDKVTVKKNYPTKILIEITEAQNWFALKQDGKTVVISRGGRVLGNISSSGLVVVKGFEAESLETGCRLNSAVEAKNKIIMEIFETAEKVGLKNITEVDITDRFSIKITIEDRIVLNIGSSSQLESKLRVGQRLIETEIGEDERVSVLLTNPEKVAVESLSHGQKPVQSTTEKPQSSAVSSSEQPPENPVPEQTSTSE